MKLYFEDKLTLDVIGKHFGYYDRQPIMRLFKKYGIQCRSKSEQGFLRSPKKPLKEEIEKNIEGLSISKASLKLDIPRKRLRGYLEEYNIKPQYFIEKDLINEICHPKYDEYSPKELADQLNLTIKFVKTYRKKWPKNIYSGEILIKKLLSFNLVKNQGLYKEIRYGDPALYETILVNTSKHFLQTTKITEKIYRIINGYKCDQVEKCNFCARPLKFYNFEQGYGFSKDKVCKECLPKHFGFGVSTISQKLFNSIFERMGNDKNCRYSNNGGEMIISIDPDIRPLIKAPKFLNKHRYHIDFVYNNKIIEFDGDYWHALREEKDKTKTELLNLIGYDVLSIKENEFKINPEETLQKCLQFLKN